ncbi:hypothetical protein [Nocardiopsis baichengensis]|uniref:hypothetical protein n=1 Tax=Nocardiopsis baichengensis TaxID=280240 RepID=UPI00034BC9CE|nr:hypothetical protein [Nocardiopsis baichengensis]
MSTDRMEHLEDDLRTALGLLALYPGWVPPAVSSLLLDTSRARRSLLLQELRTMGLLRMRGQEVMVPPDLRARAAGMLPKPAREASRSRLARRFLRTAELCAWATAPGRGGPTGRIDHDAAWNWMQHHARALVELGRALSAQGDHAAVWRLAGAVGPHLHRTGLAAELGQAAEDGLAAAQALGDGRIELAMLALAAEAETANGESAGQAADRLQHAAEQAGAERETAIGLRLRGQAAAQRGDHATALRRLRRAHSALAELDDERQQHLALRLLGQAQAANGHPREALESAGPAVGFFARLGDRAEMLAALAVRAGALVSLGRSGEARGIAEDALQHARRLRLGPVVASLHTTLAGIQAPAEHTRA